MTTLWRWRMYLFVRSVDATQANKLVLAHVYTDNGSMESVQDEVRALDHPVRLSVSGELPAQAYGLNTPLKTAMRADMQTFLDGLTNARYVVVANTKLPNYRDSEFVLTNFPDPEPDPTGKIVTWQAALNFVNREFGLQVIPDPEDLP